MATTTFKANSNPFVAGGPTTANVPMLVRVPEASTVLTVPSLNPFSAGGPTTANVPILVRVPQALTALMLVPLDPHD
jgi:hypothetical protein